MSSLNGSTWGNNSPDDRQVGVIEYDRDGENFPRVRLTGGPFVFVSEENVADFQSAAARQEWKYEIVGWDCLLKRATVRIDSTGTSPFKYLDPTNPKDLALLSPDGRLKLTDNNTVSHKKRWKHWGDDQKNAITKGVMDCLGVASRAMSPDNPTEVQLAGAAVGIRVVAAGVSIEGQIQNDEHKDEKYARLNAGLPTESIKLYDIDVETIDKV